MTDKNPWEIQGAPETTDKPLTKEAEAQAEAEWLELVAEWDAVASQLKALKIRESTLRKRIAEHYFPVTARKEGTNRIPMPEEWALKLTHKIERKIDEAALPNVLKELPEGVEDSVIKYKPSLSLRDYNKLDSKIRAILDEAIIVKDGSPQLVLERPKTK